MSNLVRGKLASFSIERLVVLLLKAGQDVTFLSTPAPKTRAPHMDFRVRPVRSRRLEKTVVRRRVPEVA